MVEGIKQNNTLVKEGVYLLENGVNPYSGDQFHQHPFILWLFRYLLINWSSYIVYIFIVLDLGTAYLLQQSTKLYLQSKMAYEIAQNVSSNAKSLLVTENDVVITSCFVSLAYLLNPFAIASCAAQTTVVFDNFMLALFLYCCFSEKKYCSVVLLSLCAVCGLYPALLVVFLAVHFGKLCSSSFDRQFWKEATYIGLMCFAMTALFVYSSVYLFWGPGYLTNTYEFILSVNDLTPNVGIFWYFLTEMFDHFRSFFVWVFQLNVLVYVVPLAITLRNDTWLMFHQYVMIIAIFKSYPCVGDVAFYMALLPSLRHLYLFLRNSFAVGCALVCTSVLAPVMWTLWIYGGSANANFYFAVTLAFSCAQIFLLADVLCAHLKRNLHLQYGMKFMLNGQPAKLVIQ